MSLQPIIDDYYSSYDYSVLADETKKQYQYFIGVMLHTKVEGLPLCQYDLKDITPRTARLAYDTWCEKGIHMANHVIASTNTALNHGLRMELCMTNPFAMVRKRTAERRKVVWSREYVQKLLDAAYSDFSTRNIGLIAHMAYEWCQRVGDMRLLKWKALDFEKRRVIILQSKRNAMVELPIDDDLYDMLVQQEQDFGFQEYVAPRPVPRHGVYAPYSQYKLPLYARKLMDEVGLPKELRLSDLRRTGVTEMVDAEVGIGQIMSVTGHANPQSVKPYLKNTYVSANNALTARKNA